MALGTIQGITRDWSDKEISGAKGAGIKFVASTPTPSISPSVASSLLNPRITTPTTAPTPTQNTFGFASAPVKTSTPLDTRIDYQKLAMAPFSKNPNVDYASLSSAVNPRVVPQQVQTQPQVQVQPQAQPQYVPQLPTQPNAFDYNTFAKFMDQYNGNKPPKQEYKPYQLDPQVMSTLKTLQDRLNTPYQYNPNTDAGLRQAQDQAIQLTRQDMARRGRVFDTYAGIQEQEAAQRLIPQYQQLGVNQYNQQTQDMGNVMNTLRNIDQTNYNRYNDAYNYGVSGEQTQYNRGVDKFNQGIQSAPYTGKLDGKNTVQQDTLIRGNKLEDESLKRQLASAEETKTRNREIADFGMELSPQARKDRQLYLTLPADKIRNLESLRNQEGGFATTINMLYDKNPNDPMIPTLQAMRTNHILSNPELLAKYGSEIAMQSGAITKITKDEAIADVKSLLAIKKDKMAILKEEAVTLREYKEMDRIDKQITEITTNIENKKADTVLKQLEATNKEIENLALPAKNKLELNKLIAEIQGVVAKTELTGAQITSESFDQRRTAAATAGEYASANAANARASESYANTKTENETRGLKVEGLSTKNKLTNAQIDKINEETDKLKNAKSNAASIGLQDLYSTYGGDIDSFIKKEGSVYTDSEMNSITTAHGKIVNSKKQ